MTMRLLAACGLAQPLFDPEEGGAGGGATETAETPAETGNEDTDALGQFADASSDDEIDAVLDEIDPLTDEDEDETASLGEAGKPPPKDADDKSESDELVIARAALARDGTPPSVLAKLNDEDILAMGTAASVRQTKIDEALAKIKTDDNPDKSGEGEGDTAPTISEVIRTGLEDVIDELGLTEEGTDALAGTIEKAVVSAVGDVGKLQESTKTMGGNIEALHVAMARNALTKEYPELAKLDRFGEVYSAMQELAESKSFRARLSADPAFIAQQKVLGHAAYIQTLMDRASSQVFAKEIAEARDKAKRGERRAKQNGSPEKPQNVQTQTTPDQMTPDQRDSALIDAIEAGDQKAIEALSYREGASMGV